MKGIFFLFGLFCICLLTPTGVFGQTEQPLFELPTTNSKSVVHQRVAATDIEITYQRPNTRGRVIFGELVPYGMVWRTGSDAATKIAFSTPVSINGISIEAGTYELFTIPAPAKEMWTIIVHKNQSQWGAYSYDSTNDVARISVHAVSLCEHIETFTISIDEVKKSTAVLNISWDMIRVPVQISIDVRQTVVPRLEEALKTSGRRSYLLAAMFYFENDIDIDRAAELIALAIKANPEHIGMLYRQALILERKGDREGAIGAAEHSLRNALVASPQLREEYTRLNTPVLERLKKK